MSRLGGREISFMKFSTMHACDAQDFCYSFAHRQPYLCDDLKSISIKKVTNCGNLVRYSASFKWERQRMVLFNLISWPDQLEHGENNTQTELNWVEMCANACKQLPLSLLLLLVLLLTHKLGSCISLFICDLHRPTDQKQSDNSRKKPANKQKQKPSCNSVPNKRIQTQMKIIFYRLWDSNCFS